MSEPKYGEPWLKTNGPRHSDIIKTRTGDIVCECYGWASGRYDERAVACVNALAGLDPTTVKRRLEERDELLAACKICASSLELLALAHEDGASDAQTWATVDSANRLAKHTIAKAEKPQ